MEAGYNVPTILVKGLEVADKVVNSQDEDYTNGGSGD